MKVEVGSFSPASSSTTVFLSDSSLQIKAMEFLCSLKDTPISNSVGFDDGNSHRCQWFLTGGTTGGDSGRSTTYSVILKDESGSSVVNVQLGNIASGGLSTPGQFTMDWAAYNITPVYFKAIGD
jgi:hypothetical protein